MAATLSRTGSRQPLRQRAAPGATRNFTPSVFPSSTSHRFRKTGTARQLLPLKLCKALFGEWTASSGATCTSFSDSSSRALKSSGSWQAPHWARYLCSYAMPLSTIAAIFVLSLAPPSLAASSIGFWIGYVAVVIGFPLTAALDVLLGRESAPKTAKADPALEAANPMYRRLLHGYALLQLVSLVLACRYVATCAPAAWPAAIGITLSQAAVAGTGFSVIHELIHSPNTFDQRVAQLQLCSACYPQWAPTHLTHHVKVATPEDATTARLNESLWAFLLRNLWSDYPGGFQMEKARLMDAGLPLWSPKNRMWSWMGIPLAMMAALWTLWGSTAVVVVLGQAAGAWMMVGMVNYIQHYGLTRKKLPSGRYEKYRERHSWNSDFVASNVMFFNLIQLHADHHVHAGRPYQSLSLVEEAPQLPTSPLLIITLAAVPPLWFRVMNPHLEREQWRIDDLERRAAAAAAAAAAPAAAPAPAAAAGNEKQEAEAQLHLPEPTPQAAAVTTAA